MAYPMKNGALHVPRNGAVDLDYLRLLSENVQTLAREQEAAGDEVDDVELSVVSGTYDWRAYLADEVASVKARMRSAAGVFA